MITLCLVATVEINKFCKRQNSTKTSADLFNATLVPSKPHFHELFFARMALGVFAKAFSCFSKSQGKKRSSPYDLWLNVKRYDQGQIAASKVNKVKKASPKAMIPIRISKIDELATSFNDRLAYGTTETHCGTDDGRVVEALGKNSLKV